MGRAGTNPALIRAIELITAEAGQLDYEKTLRECMKAVPPGIAARYFEMLRFATWKTKFPPKERPKLKIEDLPPSRREFTMPQKIESGSRSLAIEAMRSTRFIITAVNGKRKWVEANPEYGVYGVNRPRSYDKQKSTLTPEEIHQRRVEAVRKGVETKRRRYGNGQGPALVGAATMSPEDRSRQGKQSHITRMKRLKEEAKAELMNDPEFMAEMHAKVRAEIESEVQRLRGYG